MQISFLKYHSNYTHYNKQNISHPKFKNTLLFDSVSFGAGHKVDVENINFAEKFSSEDLKIINEVVDYARKTGVNIYLVGGIVRDILLEKEANDIDFVIEGDAISFAEGLIQYNNNANLIYSKPQSGISQVRINNRPIDLVSTKSKSYTINTKSFVENMGCCIGQDLENRDFTINSLALKADKDQNGNLTFVLIDSNNGVDDLNSKILRIGHKKAFENDPTRIIRGLRFRLKLGFKYDEKTRKLQEQYLKHPPRDQISKARVDTALRKLFSNKNTASIAFRKYIDEGIYRLISTNTNAKSSWGDYIAQSCELFDIKDFESLYISALDNDKTSDLLALYDKNEQLTNFEIYNKMKKLSKNDLALYWVITQDKNALKYYYELKDIKPLLSGKALMDFGYKGKQIGKILSLIMEQKLNNGALNTPEEELSFVSSLNF